MHNGSKFKTLTSKRGAYHSVKPHILLGKIHLSSSKICKKIPKIPIVLIKFQESDAPLALKRRAKRDLAVKRN